MGLALKIPFLVCTWAEVSLISRRLELLKRLGNSAPNHLQDM